MTLFEIFITSSLLAAALVLLPPMVARMAKHRQAVDQQQWALAELNNLLEDFSGRPFEQITSESASSAALSDAASKRLPDAELSLRVDGADERRKLTARLTWPVSTGGLKEVTLTTWVYREGR